MYDRQAYFGDSKNKTIRKILVRKKTGWKIYSAASEQIFALISSLSLLSPQLISAGLKDDRRG